MSALAHGLEEAGFATVVIGLVREHSQRIRPPRTLWVPFELGRPLGSPGESAQQRRVLGTAMALLERRDGRVILEDFPEEQLDLRPDPQWSPPLRHAGGGWSAEALRDEISAILPAYEAARRQRGRSVARLTGLAPADLGALLAGHADGSAPLASQGARSAVDQLRHACEDLKAVYLEAASLPGRASSRQIADWFWGETAAGAMLLALRQRAVGSDDRLVRLLGTNLMLPTSQAHRAAT